MPRLLRDSPLNSIWEGSGNVAALDVLRALVKEPEGLPAFLAECELARGGERARSTPTSTGSRPRSRGTPSSRRAASCRGPRGRAPGEPARAQRARRRWRTRSAPRGSATRRPRLRHAAARRRRRGDRRRARCPLEHAHATRSTGRVARITLDRPERGNGDHARDAARAGRVRRAGEPRPGRARDRAGRQRQGLLRRLRPGRVRRDTSRRTTTRRSRGTRCSTGR